ncbi:MAG: WD40 repeat domain-containing protein [Alphaproteobacteria bacterium]|nr:WD40 repeat domain-containing protein [Alphaproteobacteria bacterium]
MPALVDQFCPNVHDAAITAAEYDPYSGTIATADAQGVVAVQRPGESAPQLLFQPTEAAVSAVSLVQRGQLVAVGDEEGTVGVYRCDSGDCIFQEAREGARGRVRAMRGVAISPEGRTLASIAKDGIIRIWDLETHERSAAWQGFSGGTVEFDPRGQRLLAMDDQGQPRLMDLMSLQALYMDRLQMPAERAQFTLDGTMVLAVGQAGISLLRVADGALIGSFATRGGSGISNLVLSPDGRQAGAITQRSVHTFSLPDLQPVGSAKHGAPDPSGAAYWGPQGVKVAGADGLMHSGSGQGSSGAAGPVVCVGGFGDTRLAAHTDHVAVWRGHRREGLLAVEAPPVEVQVDRDGRLALVRGSRSPVHVFDCTTGRRVFDGGAATAGARSMAVGGTVVAVHLKQGGVRWWDLARNKGYELEWPQAMALSGGGTWLGVVTPKGAVKVLDPATGRDAVPQPVPLADVPVVNVAFVNRRPDMLVMDQDGVLGHYDLGTALRQGQRAEGRDVITINVEVDRLWGITGGQYAALRLPEGDRCTILWVDVGSGQVVAEVPHLDPAAWVDAEYGLILEPGRSSALVEREMDGKERRVLRALPDGEWLAFGWRGILDNSPGAGGAI